MLYVYVPMLKKENERHDALAYVFSGSWGDVEASKKGTTNPCKFVQSS